MSDATKLTELIRDANRDITPADRHAILDLVEAANARIAEFERILDGLPQDAVDGGWTARGISAYAKKLEADLSFQKQVTDAARQNQAELLERAEDAEARIAKFKSDAARLDWLDRNMFHREKNEFDSRVWSGWTMWVTFAPTGTQGSARNIIDAALANQQDQP